MIILKSQDLKKFALPDSPGVYFFFGPQIASDQGQISSSLWSKHGESGKRGMKILYIGKATSLKDRVKSYFTRGIFLTRSPLIVKMLEEAKRIEFIQTDSVLEALLLEASMIKKHQPIYNSKEKDDKSYNYVTITKEDFPKVLITRGSGTYGPFPHGAELKTALKIIRKIFPFRDKCKQGQNRPCFNAQIGLCPGVCVGWIDKRGYRKFIRHLDLFFEGEKPRLIKSLEREMKGFATEQKFEEADKVKRQIFALEHIQDIALIKHNLEARSNKLTSNFRIEAYDIAHISGRDTVGVMTVVEDGELNKRQYRKFKIHNDKNDDIANLREVLTRRFAHLDWRFPDLIVMDGGKGQINVVEEVLKKGGLNISIVSVVKDERHKARVILGIKDFAGEGRVLEKYILLANSEAHRFALGFHRQLRGRQFKL